MDFRKKIIPHLYPILFLIYFCFIFFLPQLLNIQSVVGKNNDLLFSKSNYTFLKFNFVENNHIPLWQNFTLSGSGFINDPQSPLFYPLNYLSFLIPLDLFFVISFLFHFVIGSIGMYLLTRKLGFNVIPAIISSVIYAYSPKFIGQFEAGHLSLLISYMWFPFVLYFLLMLTDSSYRIGALFLGFSLWVILINYITIFPYVMAVCLLIFIISIIKKTAPVKAIKNLTISILIFFFLSLPFLVSTIPYFSLTTRNLITDEDIGPKILSYKHYFSSIIFPYLFKFEDLNEETVLYFGILPILLFIFGFILIKSKYKLGVFLALLMTVFLSLGFKTLIYSTFLNVFPIFYLFRITTRVWFIPIIIIALLGGYFINKKVNNKKIQIFILILVAIDFFIFKNQYFILKGANSIKSAPISSSLYDLVTNDGGYYRILCTQQCIKAPIEEYKGLTSGYNPIQLKNYYHFLQQASGYEFGSYAVALPPYQTFPDKPQPDSVKAGLLGVRFIITPYQLTDPGFIEVAKYENNYVYKNINLRPRIYGIDGLGVKYPIEPIIDKPGYITFSTDKDYKTIIISEIYTPLWNAYDASGNHIKINQKDEIILELQDVLPSEFTLIYKPKYFTIAVMLWIITLFFILFESLKIVRER